MSTFNYCSKKLFVFLIQQQCLTASKFVAHLINQNVVCPAVQLHQCCGGFVLLFSSCLHFSSNFSLHQAHEILCLEMLTLLLERPTDDSVEVAISFLKECGLKLTEVSPRGINGKTVNQTIEIFFSTVPIGKINPLKTSTRHQVPLISPSLFSNIRAPPKCSPRVSH